MTRKYVPYWDAPRQVFRTPVPAYSPDQFKADQPVFYPFSASVIASPTLNGRVIHTQIRNPIDSGVVAKLESFMVVNPYSRPIGFLFNSPPIGLDLISPMTVMPRSSSGAVSRIRASSDNSQAGDSGPPWFEQFRVEANTPFTYKREATLHPGFRLLVNLGIFGQGQTIDSWQFNFHWSEGPLRLVVP